MAAAVAADAVAVRWKGELADSAPAAEEDARCQLVSPGPQKASRANWKSLRSSIDCNWGSQPRESVPWMFWSRTVEQCRGRASCEEQSGPA